MSVYTASPKTWFPASGKPLYPCTSRCTRSWGGSAFPPRLRRAVFRCSGSIGSAPADPAAPAERTVRLQPRLRRTDRSAGAGSAADRVLGPELQDQHRDDEDDEGNQRGWRRSPARRHTSPVRPGERRRRCCGSRCWPRTTRMATANSHPAHDITDGMGPTEPSHERATELVDRSGGRTADVPRARGRVRAHTPPYRQQPA